MPLDPQAKALLDVMNQAPPLDVANLDAPTMRQLFDGMAVGPPGPALDRVEDHAFAGPGGDVAVRLYAPAAAAPLPVLVYFHGGGFVIGSIETHDASCRELAWGAGCAVVSVAYRLAPEHRFPAAPEDGYAAVAWLAREGAGLGLDASRLAVGGDSAGGNLAAVVAQMALERGGPAIRHQLLVYPVTDHAFDTPSYAENAEGYMLTRGMMRWFWQQYLDSPETGRAPQASPLRAERLAGLPPATVITAEYDPLRDEGEAYATRLIGAGVRTKLVRYDGQFHGFFAMPASIDAARRAIDHACTELRDALRA